MGHEICIHICIKRTAQLGAMYMTLEISYVHAYIPRHPVHSHKQPLDLAAGLLRQSASCETPDQ
jgi:hypothetical protein